MPPPEISFFHVLGKFGSHKSCALKEGHLFPPVGTSSWLQMYSLLTALINGEKTWHFGVQACRRVSWALRNSFTCKIRQFFTRTCLASSKALPHEREESRRGKSQSLGCEGRFGGKGCVCPSAVPPVVPSDALITAFF